jgi:amino acid adenylation domain-containing protein/FkbM family methyltransferase
MTVDILPEAPSGLPVFRRRSAIYRRRSAVVSVEIPASLAPALAPAAGVEAGDPPAALVAAVFAVLYRYRGGSEQQSVTVGIETGAGPDGAESRMLATTVDVTAEMTPADLADALRALEGAPDGARVRTRSIDSSEEPNPFAVLVRAVGKPAKSDLHSDVVISLSTERDRLEIEYNAAVLEETVVANFAGHVLAFAADGTTGTPVGRAQYLTPAETDTLLSSWSSGQSHAAVASSVNQLVRAAVRRWPDQPVVDYEGRVLTYQQVWDSANRLANYLRARGVNSGSRVGIYLRPSEQQLVSLIGVLQAGATIVPIVPTFPRARNEMIAADAKIDAVICTSDWPFPDGVDGLLRLEIDALAAEISACSDEDPALEVDRSDLVYIMFTSGSTGRPKGVSMPHRGLVNLVRWQSERGLDQEGRRTMQRTSLGFDVSFQEIFSTVAYGGTLIVAPDEIRDDVMTLPGFISRNGIQRAFLPVVALDQLAAVTNAGAERLTTLAEIVVAGEQLNISMPIRRFFHEHECRLDNQYGPTESHVVSAFFLEGPSTRWPDRVPIGKPIDNVSLYLLDEHLQPVPLGAEGELYIAGDALAEGYVDPEQTRQRFMADPFDSSRPMYRTGDRARFLPSGVLEFIGRRDDQVKVRGYRIEFGEIETALRALPGVAQGVASVHESEAIGRYLAVYVVTTESGTPTSAEIRRELEKLIPDHMLPAVTAIVHVDALPLTPTGKVDRKALLPPTVVEPADSGQLAVGRTEESVAAIWAEALGVPRVGRNEGFLELGGHSLAGIRVVTQINELFRVSLPLRSLLQGATISTLAAEIDRLRSGAPADDPAAATVEASAALRLVELPGGLTVSSLSEEETRYLHLDVVERRTYERGGVAIPQTGVVVDVGSHIGLFTLHALRQSPTLKVYAFEPAPPLFEALRVNTEELSGVQRFGYGLGGEETVAESLAFYPYVTGMSGLRADREQDATLLSHVIRNSARLTQGEDAEVADLPGEYFAERLTSREFKVRLRRLSSVIAEEGIERIDLLKIDVQRYELDILAGIDDADWPRVQQVAVEVHDLAGEADRTAEILRRAGMRVTVLQDELHTGSAVRFVYGTRPA